MTETPRELSKVSSTKKSIRQKRDRRKMTLENKLQQYSEMCGADVCLGIRIRESGLVFIFSADSSGFWSFLRSQLVCALESLRGFKFPDSSRAPTIQNQLKEVKRTSVWRKYRATDSMTSEITLSSVTPEARLEDYTGRIGQRKPADEVMYLSGLAK